MREKKRVFRHFRYRECDAFAEYLREQAQQGWYFKEWRLGLVFEKGIPAAVHYEAEVFPDGTEMDTRPEPETEEYAEYCEAAGWRLIDSKRKFCIFRRERPDAFPIVTPEERLENVKRAELKSWLHSEAGILGIAVLDWIQFWRISFKQWIFHDIMLFILFAITLAAFFSILNLAAIFIWERKKKRQLSDGGIPVYGKRRSWRPSWRWCWMGILCIVVCVLAYREKLDITILLLPVFAAAFSLFHLLIEALRPARADHWLFQFIGESGLLILFVIVMFAVLFAGEQEEQLPIDLREFPLVQTDYSEADGELDFTDAGGLNGILGSERYYRLEYVSGESAPDQPEYDANFLSYEIYQTRYPWILKKLWKDEVKKLSDCEAAPDEWNAVSVYHIGAGVYRVLYQDTMLIFAADTELDNAQIQIVREKLSLP